ncbi:tRNA (guanosine(46)-N7)-methyltransferase TrmB [Microbacterium stercoris]|uniref:tRNA (guanine-N(7)-)-methyltransferase n=1 Tax=Microbacterium stercoris TaxID=2820289 RepID=A0A939QPM4_9MICO|nr:tRNA (guanosine(46)-N7)-methyltransferase TrmB [Microbacterium stercoris]MBO3663216.1 tRNA (guanosine(46)-N7)-methyltransferase TrmB [Microbacterium stercoris]
MPEELSVDAPAGDPAEDESTFRKQPVSFVRRSGRMSDAQERAWTELAPFYAFDVPRDVASTSVHPQARLVPSEVYGREAPLTVEIGSGQGHAIVSAAAAHPHNDYLAVEVFRAGLARTMLDADRAGAKNLRLVEANAPEVLETLLPEGAASEVWVFFPDPWHKARHNKRRLVKEGFGEIAGRALRDGGLLRLATDWEDYALQMREVLDADPFFERAFEGSDDPEQDWAPRFEGRVMTAFERKGLNTGRAIRDLTYRRVAR